MAIQFNSAELTEANANLTALNVRFPSLDWTYNTNSTAEVKYQGALAAPYDVNGFAVELAIPVASDGSLTYTNTNFYFIASGNLRMLMPSPSTSTRTSMTSIVEVGDWLEGFIDEMT